VNADELRQGIEVPSHQMAFLFCAGPSLMDALERVPDIREAGMPIGYVNHVHEIFKGDFWFSADRSSSYDGQFFGDELKFVTERIHVHFLKDNIQNVRAVPYSEGHSEDYPRFCDGKLPVWGGRHHGITFALQTMRVLGFRTIALAGADFRVEDNKVYPFREEGPEKRVSRKAKNLNRVFRSMQKAVPAAQENGTTIINTSPSSRLSEFTPTLSIDEVLLECQRKTTATTTTTSER
jgi:hypothetical protein